jgi:predicted nucleotidyltransferase
MLKIINTLEPFFKDCYRRISVREYAKIMNISPPTASKVLKDYFKEGLLKKEEQYGRIFFSANRNNSIFKDLSKIYWKEQLKEIIIKIEKENLSPTIILFGSLSKAENKDDSDIDIAVIGANKKIDLSKFEKKLKREIQLFSYINFKAIKNKELANNIINGYVLKGKVKL